MAGSRARTFIVECYLTGIDAAAVAEAARRAREAVEALRREGEDVQYAGATLVPEDEVVFHAFTAPGIGAVEAASRAAGLQYERIVESIDVGPGPGDGGAAAGGDLPRGKEPRRA